MDEPGPPRHQTTARLARQRRDGRARLFAITGILWWLSTASSLADPIHEAARVGDLDRVILLVNSDSRLIQSLLPDDSTPLHEAARRGHDPIARALLDRGAAPSPRNKVGLTPAHMARTAGHIDLARLLENWAARQNPAPEGRPATGIPPRDNAQPSEAPYTASGTSTPADATNLPDDPPRLSDPNDGLSLPPSALPGIAAPRRAIHARCQAPLPTGRNRITVRNRSTTSGVGVGVFREPITDGRLYRWGNVQGIRPGQELVLLVADGDYDVFFIFEGDPYNRHRDPTRTPLRSDRASGRASEVTYQVGYNANSPTPGNFSTVVDNNF